jgi:hypothetical protein
MKSVSRITTFVLTFLLLLSQLTWPASAKGQGNKPTPHFRDNAIHIEKSHRPYYGENAIVDTYLLDGLYYSVNTATDDVVEIIPEKMDYQIDATLSEDQLKEMAQKMVIDFLGDKVDFDSLVYTMGTKKGTFFFRWEEATKKLEDGTPVYIQVGLSNNGDFLNFINALPYGVDSATSQGQDTLPVVSVAPMIGPFNQIYANDGSRWSRIGTMNSATGGYCYLYPASWCQPTTYRYKAGNSNGGTRGTWTANSNTNTKAAVFIPSNNATALANYQITLGNGYVGSYQVDQNAWYNAWVSITAGPSAWGIVSIALENRGSSTNIFAWDEVWVYNP